jgi:hypothetical protein
MGTRSYGYGSVTVTPGVVLEPGDPLHPDNHRSESLVRAVIDADGVARRLVPWGIDGMASYLDEQFADDIRAAVHALAGQQFGGFFDYAEDDGSPPVSWRAQPVPDQSGYAVRISEIPEEGA